MKHETWECDRCGVTSPSGEGWHTAGVEHTLVICLECWEALGSPTTIWDRDQILRRLLRQDYQRQPRDDWSRDGVAGTGTLSNAGRWSVVVAAVERWVSFIVGEPLQEQERLQVRNSLIQLVNHVKGGWAQKGLAPESQAREEAPPCS